MYNFRTIGIIVKGALEIYRIAPDFVVSQSAWMGVTPYPDDEYLLEVKDEPHYFKYLKAQVESYPDKIRWDRN